MAVPKPNLADLPMVVEAELETCLAASPSLRTLTEKQRRFAVAISFQPKPDYGRAAQVAGYSASSKENLWRIGSATAHHPIVVNALIEMARARLGTACRMAGDTLIEIAEDKEVKAADRIRAASEILSRSGVSGTQHIEVKSETTVKHQVTLTDEDRQRFRERCERLGIQLQNEPLLHLPRAEPPIDAAFVEVPQPIDRDEG